LSELAFTICMTPRRIAKSIRAGLLDDGPASVDHHPGDGEIA
jgi:hypothetical protein